MFEVEIYGRVRRAVRVEGKSQRAVAREFGLSGDTVRKMPQYAVPPGYQRQQPIKRPKLGPWLGVIDAILSDDKQRPVKQRHTAKRIFERLKEEHGFTGGYTIVKDYVRMRHCMVGTCRAADTCAGRGAGGLRRSAGCDCGSGAEGTRPGYGSDHDRPNPWNLPDASTSRIGPPRSDDTSRRGSFTSRPASSLSRPCPCRRKLPEESCYRRAQLGRTKCGISQPRLTSSDLCRRNEHFGMKNPPLSYKLCNSPLRAAPQQWRCRPLRYHPDR